MRTRGSERAQESDDREGTQTIPKTGSSLATGLRGGRAATRIRIRIPPRSCARGDRREKDVRASKSARSASTAVIVVIRSREFANQLKAGWTKGGCCRCQKLSREDIESVAQGAKKRQLRQLDAPSDRSPRTQAAIKREQDEEC
jgi:hypothetical protein